MSKKEKRRAARQAFPKAKAAPTTKSGARSRSSAGSRSRGGASRMAPRPPTLKRAVTWGAVMAVLYFIVIQWIWRSGTTTIANVIVAAGTLVLFSGIVYFTDRFKYQRYLRKQKGPSK